MLNKKLIVGYVATSQKSFPGDKQEQMNKSIGILKQHAVAMDFELCVYNEMVIVPDDAQKARDYFEDNKIDFLLINTVSFSAGTLVPILARTKNARIGVWAIPEGVSVGVVPLNSFCSINMYTSIIRTYLKNYNIKSKWFYGYADSDEFIKRFSVTIKALSAIKAIKQSRVALIGGIAPGFDDLYFDERKVNKLLDGIYINRLHEFDEITEIVESISDSDAAPKAEEIAKGKTIHKNSKDLIMLTAKIYLAYKKFIEQNRYDALAISCWPKFQNKYRYSVCSVVGMLNDDKVIAACEGDLPSAISMLALQNISKESTMLMDMSSFDANDNSVLMWHCGPAAKNFCAANGYSLGVNYHGLPHNGKEINNCGVTRDMEFDKNNVTIFRFSQDFDKIMALEGEFLGKDKASFLGSRGWLGKLKLNGESITSLDLVNTIFANGFEHHYPIAMGSYGDVVQEIIAWLDLGKIEKVAYKDYLQM